MNPVIIGMNNPYGVDPHYALYPLPENSAGGRLYDMIREGTHLTRPQYVSMFDRYNLVSGPWNAVAAKHRICELLPQLADRHVVLLGKEVQRAFGVLTKAAVGEDRRVVRLLPRAEATFYAIPHPSGRNQWYNDPENRERVVCLLARLHAERDRGGALPPRAALSPAGRSAEVSS